MSAHENRPTVPVSLKITPEDQLLLVSGSAELQASASEIMRWALRYYLMCAPAYLIDSTVTADLRARFGALPIGPPRITLPERKPGIITETYVDADTIRESHLHVP